MIVLHHAAQSRSFRVLWFLTETGLEHEVRYHSFAGKALRDPAFLKISPAGRVPAVEFQGLDGQQRTMFESSAILEHLSERFAPDMTRPADHAERADFLEWLHYGETIAQHVAQLTFQHVVLRPADRSLAIQKLESLRLRRVLEGIETALKGRATLLPSGFSAADIMVGASVMIARRFVRLDGLAQLQDWIATLEARPGFQAAQAADGPAELYLQEFYEVSA